MNREVDKIIGLFNTYGSLKRKQVSKYTGFSDRKVRHLIALARKEQLPSIRGETIIFNANTNTYEFTNDNEKINIYKKYLGSRIRALEEDIIALNRSGIKGQQELL